MTAALLVAAHGTRSALGTATTHALVAAVARARPGVPTSVGFLDVSPPSLQDALDASGGRPLVVVPLLLSAGYHVSTDIPNVVAGRPGVRVARHLGPDPAIVSMVVDRLVEARSAERGRAEARSAERGSVALAAIASSHSSSRVEVEEAARLLSERLDEPVSVLPLGGDLADAVAALPRRTDVAVYLLAEGGFLNSLRDAMTGRGVVAEPIGTHPSLVSLVWGRYDEALGGVR